MTYRDFWRQLAAIYDEQEAKAIARTVYEDRFGLQFADIFMGKDTHLSAEQTAELEEILARLLTYEPVQYVLEETVFCHRHFLVRPGVLIPRPETAELCQWICTIFSAHQPPLCILDACCGSGCIGISLALDLPGSQVEMFDLSPTAIEVSRENARKLGADVRTFLRDALQQPTAVEQKYHLIVSNPPYISPAERRSMHRNVLDHEPESALFAPADDVLAFYKSISQYAAKALLPGGMLFFEINPLFVKQVETVLRDAGFQDIEIREDTFGKKRMARAYRKE